MLEVRGLWRGISSSSLLQHCPPVRKPIHIPRFRSFSSTRGRCHEYVRFPSSKPTWDIRSWDNGLKLGVGIFVVGSVYYVAHLEQVPETGRWRFMNTSPKFEAKIGELARAQSREEFKDAMLPPNHPISKHVRRVVSRILASSNLGTVSGDMGGPQIGASPSDFWNPDAEFGTAAKSAGKDWDVIVVNDPKMINAQVVPGLIVVYTGILPVCQDEQGLASVIAHEIGHVVARHTAERISSQTVIIGLMVLLQTLSLDFGLSDIVQKLLFELPNSRTQELEADKIGLTLMSRACFDPRAAPEMLARMGRLEAKIASKINLDFLQTHPSSASRVKHLEQTLPEGYAILAANPDCAEIQDRLQVFKEAALRVNEADGNFLSG